MEIFSWYFYLLSIYFWNCQKSEGRETKKHDFGTIFFIFKFWNFWKFRNRFWYQLKQIFPMNYYYFFSYTTFLLQFWHIMTLWNRFESCNYNAVTPGISFSMYLWLHKVLLSKRRGILSYRGLKKSVSIEKNMVLYGKCL